MLQINDHVKVVNNQRHPFLNGKVGTIIKIIGDRAEVLFDEKIDRRGYGRGAVIFLINLKPF